MVPCKGSASCTLKRLLILAGLWTQGRTARRHRTVSWISCGAVASKAMLLPVPPSRPGSYQVDGTREDTNAFHSRIPLRLSAAVPELASLVYNIKNLIRREIIVMQQDCDSGSKLYFISTTIHFRAPAQPQNQWHSCETQDSLMHDMLGASSPHAATVSVCSSPLTLQSVPDKSIPGIYSSNPDP